MVALGDHWCGMETGEPGDTLNSCDQAGNLYTVSHITIVDHGERTRIIAVTSKGIVHFAAWTPIMQKCP